MALIPGRLRPPGRGLSRYRAGQSDSGNAADSRRQHFITAEIIFRQAARDISAYDRPGKRPPGKWWHGESAARESRHGELRHRALKRRPELTLRLARYCHAGCSRHAPVRMGAAWVSARHAAALGAIAAFGGYINARGTTARARWPAGGVGTAGHRGHSRGHGRAGHRAGDLLTGGGGAGRPGLRGVTTGSRRGQPESSQLADLAVITRGLAAQWPCVNAWRGIVTVLWRMMVLRGSLRMGGCRTGSRSVS